MSIKQEINILENDLTDNLCVLEDYLDNMLDRVEEKTLSQQRFQNFELELFNAQSLDEMIELILQHGKDYFSLDLISICLLDEQQRLAPLLPKQHLNETSPSIILIKDSELLKKTFGNKVLSYLGSFITSKYSAFFPKLKNTPVNIVLLPLFRHDKYLGSLNLGSNNTEHFAHSTDFLQHLAAVVSICLENQINYELSTNTYH